MITAYQDKKCINCNHILIDEKQIRWYCEITGEYLEEDNKSCDKFDCEEKENKYMEEIHIWLDLIGREDYENEYICKTYIETLVMLKDETQSIVHTTQTHFCQFRYGKIFVHTNGKVHEITKGDCEGTGRDIKAAHNIEKMLLAGEFNWYKDDDAE